MKVSVGADHGGFDAKSELVEFLKLKKIEVIDEGTMSSESVDYPDFAEKVCQDILSGRAQLGILVCGTGIGISIAANRHKGIRAALLYSDEAARLAKLHNNANIAVFGGRTMSVQEMEQRLGIRLEKLDVDGGC